MTENERIRKLRWDKDLTLKDFGEQVGVTKGAMSAIETGKRGVTDQMRKAICREFNVNPEWLKTGEGEMYSSDDEDELRAFASRFHVSDEGVELVRFVLSLEEETQQDILDKLRALVAAQNAPEDADIDARVEAYRAALEAGSGDDLRYIRLYRTPAAAGFASPIEGEDYDLVSRDEKTPWNADFAVRIQGDSMEPYIKNGDIVYVRRGASLEDGDVGIFYYDGDVLCKQFFPSPYGDVYLVSANRARAALDRTIQHNSTSTLVCLGQVILPGKLPVPKF